VSPEAARARHAQGSGELTPQATTAGAVVRAAGGVVWRRSPAGALQIVLVHRPRYDDWSLPKGKVDPGESDEQAALREVLEETSLRARLGPELQGSAYTDSSGRPKRVRYWAMTPEDCTAEPAGAHEVDEAAWFELGEARSRLSYGRDLEVVSSLEQLIG
jgi:8-oxo-dGTP pyrophosphatase MutT (NUDIX family)